MEYAFGEILKLLVSINIILLNKYIYFEYIFPVFALTALQFFTTFILLGLAIISGYLKIKNKISLFNTLKGSFLFTVYYSFSNLSLEYNSIEYSQLFKFLNIPIMLLLNLTINGQIYSKISKYSSALILVNILLNSYYSDDKLIQYQAWTGDKYYNLRGFLLALISIVSGSFYQFVSSFIFYS
jgi:hypothetical protein